MTEKDLQRTVLSMAKMFGWRTAHFGNTVKVVRRGDKHVTIADKGAAGFPDLTLVRAPRLVFAELKRDGQYLKPEQKEWFEALESLPFVEMYLWRPRDLDDIALILR